MVAKETAGFQIVGSKNGLEHGFDKLFLDLKHLSNARSHLFCTA
jgi:hypothetical protein